MEIDFNDTEIAFATVSDAELKRMHTLFKLMNAPILNYMGTVSLRLAFALWLPINALVKKTVFTQFCGGETISECQTAIDKLAESQIGTILDYSIERKRKDVDFERTKDETIRTIQCAQEDPNIMFAVFKVTGIAPLALLEKVASKQKLNSEDMGKYERLNKRVREICEAASRIDHPVLIDAEESWIQTAIDDLATQMMKEYNSKRAIVFNTLQMYRTDRLEFLRHARASARRDGYVLGVKIVRGAYMEKERARAKRQRYPSPIHPEKESSDEAYDAAIDYCLDHLEDIAFVAGTHNDKSIQKIVQKLRGRSISKNHPHIFFAQLFGMGDNLSYILAKNGYKTSKYLPYGPVREAIPYLIRRAYENSSIKGQVSRELDLIEREIKRRDKKMS